MDLPAAHLITAAIQRTRTAYRPSTRRAHNTHIRTYFSFLMFMSLPLDLSVKSLLAFLEYLHSNSLSSKVILNYLSSLKFAARQYNWDLGIFSHHLILAYTRSISINPSFNPTPRGIFDLKTLAQISTTCNILDDPPSTEPLSYLHFLPF